jgi:hypothetical protein
MWRAVIWALPLALLVPAAWAQKDGKDTPAPAKQQTPAEEYSNLRKEYEKKQQEVIKEYQEAKTAEEKKKAFEKWPKPSAYTGKALKLVEKNPKADFAVDALVWVVAENQGAGADADKAMTLLLKDHIKSQRLSDVCATLADSTSATAEKQLEAILAKSPHHDVQGQACFALAQNQKNRADRADPAKPDAKLTKSAEKLFERVIEKYGDVKYYSSTLSEQAKGELFELRNLAIGKVAPEIEGEDIGGKKFKLSDYRGKVVVLDFWGNW